MFSILRKSLSLLFISTLMFLKTFCIIYFRFNKLELKFSILNFFWYLGRADAYSARAMTPPMLFVHQQVVQTLRMTQHSCKKCGTDITLYLKCYD